MLFLQLKILFLIDYYTLLVYWHVKSIEIWIESRRVFEGFFPSDKMGDNIKVVVRLRPRNESELREPIIVKEKGNSVTVQDRTFHFDKVFGSMDTQQDIFVHVAAEMLDQARLSNSGISRLPLHHFRLWPNWCWKDLDNGR